MKGKDKRRQRSIGRRIKNKVETTLFSLGMVAFIYYAFIKRGSNHGKEKKAK